MLEPARSHPVATLLILLNLLERQAKGIRKRRLAHAEHNPAHAHPAADMLVGGMRSPLGHPLPPPRAHGCARPRPMTIAAIAAAMLTAMIPYLEAVVPPSLALASGSGSGGAPFWAGAMPPRPSTAAARQFLLAALNTCRADAAVLLSVYPSRMLAFTLTPACRRASRRHADSSGHIGRRRPVLRARPSL